MPKKLVLILLLYIYIRRNLFIILCEKLLFWPFNCVKELEKLNSGILRDKTLVDELIYIPYEDKQNHPVL